MRILFVNHHASAPKFGNPYRQYYLAKELAKQGYEVSILASSFSHVRQSQPTVEDSYQSEMIDGINYIWLKSPNYASSILSRLKNIFAFLFMYFKYRNKIINEVKPDVIYEATTHLLTFFISKRVSKKSSAKLFYEVRDLWPLSIIEIGGYSAKNPLVKFLAYTQKTAIEKSDLVISNLKYADKYFNEQAFNLKDFFYLPNGINPDDFNCEAEVDNSTIKELQAIREKCDFIIGYTGAIGKANSVDYLVESADYFDSNKVAIVIVGDGFNKANLVQKVQESGTSNVYFLDPVPKKYICNVLKFIDLGFVGGRSRNIHKYGVSPNKLYDYMYNYIPVLFALDTDDNIVKVAKCGITVDEFSPRGISKSINLFIELPQNKRGELAENGHSYIVENHDYARLSEALIKCFSMH
jgi:hypothetical protein